MTAQPPWATPIPWSDQDITLYHGTLDRNADAIVKSGVSLEYAKPGRDFGSGFYTTTLKRQAEAWANIMAANTANLDNPAIVEFIVPRDNLARLDCLWFIRSGFDADDFWSFIFHCRGGQSAHGRATGTGWYDIVVGSVTAFWQQRAALQDSDQVSFHTDDAI
ncbi:MAG: DUF3990 domain-containing protein, partial [Chloroflexi bacterium]|nr:DUF3990 domain-containing protein [Chloroflexota bacterium]